MRFRIVENKYFNQFKELQKAKSILDLTNCTTAEEVKNVIQKTYPKECEFLENKNISLLANPTSYTCARAGWKPFYNLTADDGSVIEINITPPHKYIIYKTAEEKVFDKGSVSGDCYIPHMNNRQFDNFDDLWLFVLDLVRKNMKNMGKGGFDYQYGDKLLHL